MSAPLNWAQDGPSWPHHEHSQFVQAGGLRWHVQRFDSPRDAAPSVLLLHGTGASSHSWRELAPWLAADFDVLALDLPGHAFTGLPPGGTRAPQLSLPGMAQALQQLLQTLHFKPALVVGHSAGAAVAIRMAIDGLIAPQLLMGLNAALLPLGGMAGQLFAPAAKLMASLPFVPQLFAKQAQQPAALQRLLDSTGSTLDAASTDLYRRLVSSPAHAAGALGMMAQWDLHRFARDLPQLATPLLLLVGENDLTVPPSQGQEVLARLSRAAQGRCIVLPGLGHLAHEEQPAMVARHILSAFQAHTTARP